MHQHQSGFLTEKLTRHRASGSTRWHFTFGSMLS